MCAILCLSATHLSALQPHVHRYSQAALQLLGTSASLFGGKLSNPITTENICPLIATSILMHYISWSHIEFLEGQPPPLPEKPYGGMVYLLQDPLFRLSSGVRGIFAAAFQILWASDSVFLSTSLYSPGTALEEAILQHGDDPHRFVGRFMAIWDDRRYRPHRAEQQREGQTPQVDLPCRHLPPGEQDVLSSTCPKTKLNYMCPALPSSTLGAFEKVPESRRDIIDPQRASFLRIAKRLSLLFCLVSISVSSGSTPSHSLARIQPDIERGIFTFPVLCGAVFRDLALQDDPRVLVMLCHFYKAARILLTSSASWWARRRSRAFESLILLDLKQRGLGECILGEECDTGWG